MTEIQENEEIETWEEFVEEFTEAASFQGRLCYCFMSIHAVNPYIFHRFVCWDPNPYLLFNALYGFFFLIAARPGFRRINMVTRCTMGILGSLGFVHASINYFEWLHVMLPHRIVLRTLLGYLGGRLFLMNLLTYLYHVDTRTISENEYEEVEIDPAFESLYIS